MACVPAAGVRGGEDSDVSAVSAVAHSGGGERGSRAVSSLPALHTPAPVPARHVDRGEWSGWRQSGAAGDSVRSVLQCQRQDGESARGVSAPAGGADSPGRAGQAADRETDGVHQR